MTETPGHNSRALSYRAPGIFQGTYVSKESFEPNGVFRSFTTAILLFCLFDSSRRNCVLWDVRLADCLKENTNITSMCL